MTLDRLASRQRGSANRVLQAGHMAMIKCSIRTDTDCTAGDNNHLPLQASFSPRKTGAHAAPQAETKSVPYFPSHSL